MAETTIQLTGSSSWTVPAGVNRIKVWCVGAGGGSSGNVSSNGVGRGGGGGALGYFSDYVTVPTGTTISYTVGVGGAGATSTTTNGSAGGFTVFGSNGDAWYIFGLGGGGGTYNSSVGAGGGANNTFGFVSVAGSPGGGSQRYYGGAAGKATGYTTGDARTGFTSPGLVPGGGASSHSTQNSVGAKGGDGALYVTYDDTPVTPPTPTYDATKFFLLF